MIFDDLLTYARRSDVYEAAYGEAPQLGERAPTDADAPSTLLTVQPVIISETFAEPLPFVRGGTEGQTALDQWTVEPSRYNQNPLTYDDPSYYRAPQPAMPQLFTDSPGAIVEPVSMVPAMRMAATRDVEAPDGSRTFPMWAPLAALAAMVLL